jgi:hypothetical protein
MHDVLLENVNSLKDIQFRFIMTNSYTYKRHPDYTASKFFTKSTPKDWQNENTGSAGTCSYGYNPSNNQMLINFTRDTTQLELIRKYINNSDDPHIIWKLEKFYKSSNDTECVEWNCYVFGITAGWLHDRVTNGSWNKWLATHSVCWTNPYTEPPTEPPTKPPTKPPTELPTELPTKPPTEPPTKPSVEIFVVPRVEPSVDAVAPSPPPTKASQTAIDNMRTCSAIWPSDLTLFHKAVPRAPNYTELMDLVNRVREAMKAKDYLSTTSKGITAKRNLDATIVQILDGTFSGHTNNAWNLWLANNPEYVTSPLVPIPISLIPKASLNVNRVGAPMDRCGYCSPHCRCPYDGPCGDRPEGRNR